MHGFSLNPCPFAGDFRIRIYVIFHLKRLAVFKPHPSPTQKQQRLYYFPTRIHPCIIYIPTYTRLLIIAACMACHLTDSQISLQADWLWLCSLQASVHIYTVTYRVTCRFSGIGGGIMGNYFLRIYAKTTNMAKMMITMMCTGNYLFNSLMVKYR